MKYVFASLVIFAHAAIPMPIANAQTLGFNQSQHVCGAYTFDITRIIDGFQINVTDGHRVRSLFYPDSFINGGTTSNYASIISGCQDNSLAILDRANTKHNERVTVHIIDPTPNHLQIQQLVTRETDSTGPIPSTHTMPAEASSTLDVLLAKPTDPWSVTRSGLVEKHRIAPEASNMLNDNSYYIFNNKGGTTRKTTHSTWNTTFATDSINCNGVSYVMYEKKYAALDTTTSTDPAEQYIIERTTPTSHAFIPVPWKDGAWRIPYEHTDSFFRECFGQNVALDVSMRMTMVTPTTVFADYVHPHTSIEPAYRNGVYYQAGNIWLDWDAAHRAVVKGDATLHILNANGTVTERKPIFFRDIRQYTDPTSMSFRLDLKQNNLIDVVLSQTHASNQPELAVFQENNGVYTPTAYDPLHLVWSDAYVSRSNTEPTPLYVSADNNMLTVRSYYLSSPMLLHDMTNMSYTLRWNRIGPLEQDGTRKIWYAFKHHGVTQTWFARVR